MKHIKLRNVQQFDGGFTDLFIVGYNQVRSVSNGVVTTSSDFTAAATSQTITLLALNIGDIVLNHSALFVKTAVTGGAVSAMTASLGVTSATTRLLATVDVFTNAVAAGGTFTSAAVDSYATIAASKNLLLTMASTGGNMSAITAGELWIYTKIMRVQDFLTNRDESPIG